MIVTLPTSYAALPSVLKIGGTGFPSHFDPHDWSDTLTERFIDSTYQALIESNSMGELHPVLVDHWKQHSQKLWEFHLKTNIFFASGEGLSGEDVVFSFQRAKKDDSPYAALLKNIQSVVSISEGSAILIRLHRPDPYFLRVLSHIKIVGRNCCNANKGSYTPDNIGKLNKMSYGTGPFHARYRWNKKQGLFIVLSPALKFDAEPTKTWERMEYYAITDASARANSFRKHEIHVNLDSAVAVHPKNDISTQTSFNTPHLFLWLIPWFLDKNRDDVAQIASLIRNEAEYTQECLLKTSTLYQYCSSSDLIWSHFWKNRGYKENKETEAFSLESLHSRHVKLSYANNRHSLLAPVAHNMVKKFKEKGLVLELEAVNSQTLDESLIQGKIQTALIEWTPQHPAALLQLAQMVCPMPYADSTGCQALWDILRQDMMASSRAKRHTLKAIESLNQQYNWWIPVLRPFYSYQHAPDVALKFDMAGRLALKNIIPF